MSTDDDDPHANAAAAAATAGGPGGNEIAFPLPDAASSFALDRINDIIDFESEMTMLDRDHRQSHWSSLRFFWQFHPAKNVPTGRRYARFLIAQMLANACSEPYSSKGRNGENNSNAKKAADPTAKATATPLESTTVATSKAEKLAIEATPAAAAAGADVPGFENAARVHELNEKPPGGPALDQWSRQDWQRLQDDLEHLREVLIRQDATKNYEDTASLDEPQEAQAHEEVGGVTATAMETARAIGATATRLDVKRSQSAAFSSKYETITLLLETHKALAPIRRQLENALFRNSSDESDDNLATVESAISPNDMEELFVYATGMPNSSIQGLLLELFEPAADAGRAEGEPPSAPEQQHQRQPFFKTNRQELKDFLSSKAFDFAYFQQKLENVLLRFNGKVCGKNVPLLLKLQYTFDGSNARKVDAGRAVNRPSPALVSFLRATESKPLSRFTPVLPSTNKKAPPAKSKASKKKGKKRKKSDPGKEEDKKPPPPPPPPELLLRLDRDDRDDALEANRARGTKKVRAPRSRRSGRSLPSTPEGVAAAADILEARPYDAPAPPPDDGIFDEMGKVLKRIKWSEEEKDAVKDGVRTIGVGRWMEIKEKHGHVLRNRTSVQIKDCWRTMTKSKTVIDEDDVGEEKPTEEEQTTMEEPATPTAAV